MPRLNQKDLERRVLSACQQVAVSKKYIGACYPETMDACNEAMNILMKDSLHKRDIPRAMKMIREYQWMMTTGKLI